jgi:hypothetical protein
MAYSKEKLECSGDKPLLYGESGFKFLYYRAAGWT